MKRSFFRAALWCAVAAVPASCGLDPISFSEIDAVVTISEEVDYSSYRTFALTRAPYSLCQVLDTGVKLGGVAMGGQVALGGGGLGGALFGGRSGLSGEDCDNFDRDFDDATLERAAKELTERGYEEVALDESPDLILLFAVVTRPAGWFYDPAFVWCDPSLDYSCWVPKKPYDYAFPPGSMLLTLIDAEASEFDQLESVWFSAMPTYYASGNFEARAESFLATAFQQSPYLSAKDSR